MGLVAVTLGDSLRARQQGLFLQELLGQGHPKDEQDYETGGGGNGFHWRQSPGSTL